MDSVDTPCSRGSRKNTGSGSYRSLFSFAGQIDARLSLREQGASGVISAKLTGQCRPKGDAQAMLAHMEEH